MSNVQELAARRGEQASCRKLRIMKRITIQIDDLDIGVIRNALQFWYVAGKLQNGQPLTEGDNANIRRIFDDLGQQGQSIQIRSRNRLLQSEPGDNQQSFRHQCLVCKRWFTNQEAYLAHGNGACTGSEA